ncbi:hypothetical protein ABPG72_013869 [Tetrahymena utriculariae]
MDIFENSAGIFCDNHTNHKVNFIKISQENSVEFKCDECAIEEGYLKEFISMQTIELCSDEYVFFNWPPVNDNNLLKQIKGFQKSDSILIEQIQQQFDKIIEELTSHLQQEKKKLIQQVISFRDRKEEILQFYKNISQIVKLKSLTNFSKGNVYSQIAELKSFVSDYFKQQDENTQLFQENLEKLTQEQIYKFDDFDELKKATQSQLYNFSKKIRQIIQLDQYFGASQDLHKLFGKLSFCNSYQSRQIEYEENLEQKKISIKKNSQSVRGQVYFNYCLNKQKKYVSRFKFNDEAGDYFMIGLMDWTDSSEDLSSTHLAKAFCNSIQSYGGKVVQGRLFYKVKKEQIVEMRIDLENKKVQFLDYPDYECINELNDDYKLNQDGTYFLAIQFGKNDNYQTSIDLIYFQEISK